MLRLVERDFVVFRQIYRWRFCLGRHIKELAGFTGVRACDRRLRVLIDSGYIDRKKILYGVPSVYFLTHKGKTLLGVYAKAEKFRVEKIAHDIAVIDTAIYMMKNRDVDLDNVITEKELYSKEGFNTRKHFPDFVFEKDNIKTCVEIELTQKAKYRFEKNIEGNYLTYDKQIWVVPKLGYKIRDLLNGYMTTYPNIEILDLEEVQNTNGNN